MAMPVGKRALPPPPPPPGGAGVGLAPVGVVAFDPEDGVDGDDGDDGDWALGAGEDVVGTSAALTGATTDAVAGLDEGP